MKENNAKPTQVYLFVNKDQQSKSLSKSDGAIAKEINSHTQQVRNKRLEAHKVSSARQSSSAARRIALRGWNTRDSEDSLNQENATKFPSPDVSQPISTPSTVHTQSSVLSDSTSPRSDSYGESSNHGRLNEPGGFDSSKSVNPRLQEVSLPSLLPRANFSGNHYAELFGQPNVNINNQLHSLLQRTLYLYAYSGNNYKLAFLPPHLRAGIDQFPIAMVVQRSIFKEHHLYSLMAAMAARFGHLYGNSSEWSQTRPEQFRATASHFLRKELIRNSQSGEFDKHTLLDILFLTVNEMHFNHLDSARKHLAIVGKLYNHLDQREHFDHWISETAAHVDNQMALVTGNRPVLPQNFDPGPLLPERMATMKREVQQIQRKGVTPRIVLPSPRALAIPSPPVGHRDAIADLASKFDLRMGSRFELGLKMGVFDARMSRVVRDLVDCVRIAKVVWLSPLAVCFDAEWLCRKARSVLRALLSIAPERCIGPLDMFGKCMESARLSLLIMMSHACTTIGFQTAKRNAERLKQAMDLALEFWCPAGGWDAECKPRHNLPLEPFFAAQAGFVLWSAMVGIFAAWETPIEDWFSIRAVNICRTLGLLTFDDLQDHMQHYLYSKSLQEDSVWKITKRIEAENSKI